MASDETGQFAKDFCVMHIINNAKSKLTSFTYSSWCKFISFAAKWRRLSSKEGEIALESESRLGLNLDSTWDSSATSSAESFLPIPARCKFHRECYNRFCNVQMLSREEKRQAERDELIKSGVDVEQEVPPEKQRRLSRSHTSIGIPDKGREHVLPPVCIICKKTKYIVDREKKRNVERLKKVETFTAGRLLEAARLKQRHDILIHLEGTGRDLPALEPRYHHSCYMQLTRFLTKPEKDLPKESLHYGKAYKKFCETVIQPKILEDKQIMLLTSLMQSFVKIVKEIEDVDTPYRSTNLKQRLQKSFPQLQFTLAPPMGDIVYSGAIEASELVKSAVGQISRDQDTSNDSSEAEEINLPPSTSPGPTDQDNLRTTYFSSQIVRNAIEESTSNLQSPWPPTAAYLNINCAKQIVPHQLFNWIAWTTGVSEDPEANGYVKVEESEEKKILSIAQDIIYLKAKGRIITPKHHTLSMTVRHMTGSSQLIQILNGLGHSTSHSATLEHDTALAQYQLSLGDLPVPEGIKDNRFSTIVWDNIDFGEETLSGKGTTHSTNGIIIQRVAEEDSESLVTEPTRSITKTKQRSIKVPSVRLEPYFGTSRDKDGPACIGQDLDIKEDTHQSARLKPISLDQAFLMTRIPSADNTNTAIPSWTGFNTLLVTKIPQLSKIGYLPVIDASPTEMETVKTILTRSIQYADLLHLTTVVLVFDQAIYAKAQKIRWEDDNEDWKKRLVVRLGGFHAKMSYLACIGQRYKDAGLADIVVESGLVASGSVNGVMNGHHYNRSVRTHKIASEALQRLRFQQFLHTLSEEDTQGISKLIARLQAAYPTPEYQKILEEQEFVDMISTYGKFIHTESLANSNFEFWSSYINMVEELLLFTRATREGNWPLHLSAVRSMLPWYFAYNRTNYCRYLSAYYLEMCDLPNTHPDVHEKFMAGEFCVQRQKNHGFSQVECDITIEQTCNRDSKTKGGLTGFTQNKAAVHRWVLSQPARAAITKECKEMASQNQEARVRRELDKSRIACDEKDIQKVMSTIDSMVNPFCEEESSLLQLSSGVIAEHDLATDLLTAKKEGEKLFQEFATQRLQSKSVKFSETLKKRKVLTFGTMGKKKVTKAAGREITFKADKKLFARLILVGNARKIQLDEMLKYNLGPLPLAISSLQGTLVKTNKATLLHHIEGAAGNPLVDVIPHGSVWVLDGMVMFQQLKNREIPEKFGDLAKFILARVIGLATRHHSTEVHFVTDCYPVVSIKNAERSRRAATGSERIHIYSAAQPVPRQWNKFLANGENKENLVVFLFEEWKKSPVALYQGITVFLAHGQTCHALRAVDNEVVVVPIPSLRCNHEEADTRLLLHAHYAADHAETVVVKSLDTDVFIIGLGMCKQISSELLLHTGKAMNVRTINLQAVRQQIGDDITHALIGLHAITGCDSVSGFYGKGKVKAAKLLFKEKSYQQALGELGMEPHLSEELLGMLEKYICHLYGQADCADVNKARYNLFCLGKHSEELLPPTKDSLTKHLMRANYQAALWRRSLEQVQDLPGPVGNGWQLADDGTLEVHWCDLPPAPESILKTVQCACKTSGCGSAKGRRSSVACGCIRDNLPCTTMCQCQGCTNKKEEDNIDDDEVNGGDIEETDENLDEY